MTNLLGDVHDILELQLLLMCNAAIGMTLQANVALKAWCSVCFAIAKTSLICHKVPLLGKAGRIWILEV